ncbi:unnamed protein product [Pleuronectes platessa]|uniref:Uncharacterized protein n=1 Tax=Pleuronectes platessa TaxID=8262 RepID=A0A9N7YWN6_PLEPL|nr:unnamed protein product [Pleuronectes platessa]
MQEPGNQRDTSPPPHPHASSCSLISLCRDFKAFSNLSLAPRLPLLGTGSSERRLKRERQKGRREEVMWPNKTAASPDKTRPNKEKKQKKKKWREEEEEEGECVWCDWTQAAGERGTDGRTEQINIGDQRKT